MKSIYKRLDEIIPKITDRSFRESKGLGNEIGYYIFDYEPKHEMLVRDYIKYIKQKVNNDFSEIKVKEFDLYEIMLEILNNKGYLEKNFKFEESKGSEYVFNATRTTMRLTKETEENLIVKHIVDNIDKNDIVFITGVGKVWPIIRSHKVLNNLHPAVDFVPVVMFFPGSYDGRELVLFDEIKDDNYYRAFQLIDKY